MTHSSLSRHAWRDFIKTNINQVIAVLGSKDKFGFASLIQQMHSKYFACGGEPMRASVRVGWSAAGGHG